MPKVKLSALVSDIKGKSNGSVFSSNSGGVYFRNNPSGGGRKSAKWNDQKNNFATLASQWKDLTSEQQESWADMASSYPTVNAFGDPRIPSGYELYMRLNGSLVSYGFDTILMPSSPESMPTIPSAGIGLPDLYQFQPDQYVPLGIPGGRNARIFSENFIQGRDFELSTFFCVRVIPQGSGLQDLKVGQQFDVMNLEIGEIGELKVVITPSNNTNFSILVIQNFEDDSETPYGSYRQFTVSKKSLYSPFHLSLGFDFANLPGANLYLNGILLEEAAQLYYDSWVETVSEIPELTPIAAPTITMADYSASDLSLWLGSDIGSQVTQFAFSDFRVYYTLPSIGSCTVENPPIAGFDCNSGRAEFTGVNLNNDAELTDAEYRMLTIAYGYYDGNIMYQCPLNRMTSGIFDSYEPVDHFGDLILVTEPECTNDEDCTDIAGRPTGSDVECQGGKCVYVGDNSTPFIRSQLTNGPLIAFQALGDFDTKFRPILRCTGQVSNGKSFLQSKMNTVLVFPDINTNYLFSADFLGFMGNVGGNSSFGFEVAVINIETGQVYDTLVPVVSPPKTGVRRFKAGVEMPGNVN